MSKTKKIKVGFERLVYSVDENLLDPKYCTKAYNCTFKGGILKSDFGIRSGRNFHPKTQYCRQEFGEIEEGAIKRILHYRKTTNGEKDDRIIAVLYNGSVYYTKLFAHTTWEKIENINIQGHITSTNYRYNGEDVLLISSETNNLIVLDDITATIIADAPKFESITIHNERVYGALNESDNQIWFSDDFDPTNWTIDIEQAGFINFADECGEVIKVISFSNYLYIFRERGIYRLTAYANQSEFLLKKLFVNTGRIYAETIAECGDNIIFYCDEGLMQFNGYDVSSINMDVPKLIVKNHLVGRYYRGSYYLACGINDSTLDTYANNVLIKIKLKDKKVEIFAPLDIADMLSVSSHHASMLYMNLRDEQNDKQIAEIDDFFSKYFDKKLTKIYKSPFNNLGHNGFKVIKEISFISKNPINLKVLIDGQIFKYKIEGNEYMQSVFVGQSGFNFGIEIETENEFLYLTPLIVEVEFI